jgi:hypothetical protein
MDLRFVDLDSYMLFTNISGGISGTTAKRNCQAVFLQSLSTLLESSDLNLDLGYLGHFEPMHELHVRSD